jgi:hypothetical protein
MNSNTESSTTENNGHDWRGDVYLRLRQHMTDRANQGGYPTQSAAHHVGPTGWHLHVQLLDYATTASNTPKHVVYSFGELAPALVAMRELAELLVRLTLNQQGPYAEQSLNDTCQWLHDMESQASGRTSDYSLAMIIDRIQTTKGESFSHLGFTFTLVGC